MLEQIRFGGPMSVAQYMRSALTHPLGGYYMKRDVFGAAGDFTTSPEISQMFGELIGIWFITHWQALGSPNDIQIVEMGPGRGTLMADMLRALGSFPQVMKTIRGVHMVDASPHLRQMQAKMLEPSADVNEDTTTVKRQDGLAVHWHESLDTVPEGVCTMFIAHEFFDAMPVYKFQLTDAGWREIMVTIDESPDSPHHFAFVLSEGPTKASKTIMAYENFQNKYKVGDRIEVAPDSYAVSNRIAKRIKESGGGALFVDYGRDYALGDSLRGIAKHDFVNVLSTPGEADISADVDFRFLRESTKDLAAAHGPITQSTFLRSMGIAARMKMLLKDADAQKRRDLASGFDRLISPEGMGTVYKFLAITPLDSPVPYPFQPDPLMEQQESEGDASNSASATQSENVGRK
ncbi:S-adenosyl-L-methionine-dependent methyltransferase [Geranomyces variabilis]|nr:S-adenosyl-L-methionine-dependent methyltransferase [Geranomyces variabilis]KAJ3132101.1 NADH dehydrogenase [ubiquinone] complex I, assembly factor 7 [Geranomyces variabilis]